MKKLLVICFVGLAWSMLVAFPASAVEQSVSETSIRALIEVTQSKKLFEQSLGQMDTLMQSSMQQALAGETFTEAQSEVLAEMRGKMVALLRDEMRWEDMEPQIIGIYRKTFTQSEVDGMLAFYKSESGQAVISKMPLVMQESMLIMQQRMQSIIPKLKQLADETVSKLKKTSVE